LQDFRIRQGATLHLELIDVAGEEIAPTHPANVKIGLTGANAG
jgi:hypothetical protein